MFQTFCTHICILRQCFKPGFTKSKGPAEFLPLVIVLGIQLPLLQINTRHLKCDLFLASYFSYFFQFFFFNFFHCLFTSRVRTRFNGSISFTPPSSETSDPLKPCLKVVCVLNLFFFSSSFLCRFKHGQSGLPVRFRTNKSGKGLRTVYVI